MTEDEARTKWCPMVEAQTCVGTDCMAWRWSQPPAESSIEVLPSGEERTLPAKVGQGRCGLAR